MTGLALPLPARRELDRSEVLRYRYLIAFAVVLASTLELVDTSIVNVAIPHMMGSLGATLDEIAWVSTGYIVANVIVLPITGWLSARFGRRNYYTASIILFTFASFMAGHAHTLEELIAARVIQGVGGAALISTAQAILFDVFPLEERGIAMALFGVGVMVGPTIGPTLGGWLTDNYSWPWIFYVNIPLGILAGVMCWRFVPEPEHTAERTDRMDWLGLAFLVAGIGALQVMLERGESKNWFDTREIVVEAVIAAVALVGFVWHELTVDHPIVDLRILRNRQLAAGVGFGVALGFGLYASVFALPVFLQTLLGYSAWDTGLVILPGAIAAAITMGAIGRLSNRIDARILIAAGGLLFLWAMWLHSRFTLAIGMHDVFWPMVLRGIGLGLIFPPLSQLTVADLHPRYYAQGTGLFNLSRQLGGSFGIAVATTLLSRWSEHSRAALVTHVTAGSGTTSNWLAAATHRMMQLGGSAGDASRRAYALLDYEITRQASVIAFEKVFLTMGLTLAVSLLLLLLFRTGRTMGGTGGAH